MAVACGLYHTVMVAEEGRAVLACGSGGDGQLGNGSYEDQRVPGPVSGLAEVLDGARGDGGCRGHSLLLSLGGEHVGKGSNDMGQWRIRRAGAWR